MALTSLSTLQDAYDQYADNLAWDNDPIKAALALESMRWLLINRSRDTYQGSDRMSFESLQQEKEKLEKYVESTNANALTNRSPFTRGLPL